MLARSNGISLQDDGAQASTCAAWPGPYMRWAAIRGDAISGLTESSSTVCGTINATNPAMLDVLVKANTFTCPPGAQLPGGGVNVAAAHSVVVAP